jgi:DNA modification methylase
VTVTILNGDCRTVLKSLPSNSVHCCVSSPPYFGLRDYQHGDQIGLEATPDEFVAAMVEVFSEVRRVLREDGTLWLNLGDSYAGSWGAQSRGDEYPGGLEGTSPLHARQIKAHPKGQSQTGSLKNTPGLKNKDLIGIPWRVAFALQADGWYLRQDIIWHKPNPMPESVTDRCTKAHEYIFLFSKNRVYHFDHMAIKEDAVSTRGPGNKKPYDIPGQRDGKNANKGGNIHNIGLRETRNRRSVWSVTTKPFKGAHFATFPPDLIEPCIIAGCPHGGTVLDPFFGAGTTGLVASAHGRNAIGIEVNPTYIDIATTRIFGQQASVYEKFLEFLIAPTAS